MWWGQPQARGTGWGAARALGKPERGPVGSEVESGSLRLPVPSAVSRRAVGRAGPAQEPREGHPGRREGVEPATVPSPTTAAPMRAPEAQTEPAQPRPAAATPTPPPRPDL